MAIQKAYKQSVALIVGWKKRTRKEMRNMNRDIFVKVIDVPGCMVYMEKRAYDLFLIEKELDEVNIELEKLKEGLQ